MALIGFKLWKGQKARYLTENSGQVSIGTNILLLTVGICEQINKTSKMSASCPNVMLWLDWIVLLKYDFSLANLKYRVYSNSILKYRIIFIVDSCEIASF